VCRGHSGNEEQVTHTGVGQGACVPSCPSQNSPLAHLRRDARGRAAGGVDGADKVGRLDNVDHVVDDGADLAPAAGTAEMVAMSCTRQGSRSLHQPAWCSPSTASTAHHSAAQRSAHRILISLSATTIARMAASRVSPLANRWPNCGGEEGEQERHSSEQAGEGSERTR